MTISRVDPSWEALRQRVREFVDTKIIPAENTILQEDQRGSRETLSALRTDAKAAGLFTPHLPEAYGGLGLGVMGMCVLFREMGRSFVGPKVFNCDAPDQGNMDLLLNAASASLREKYLAPLARGEITSAFCMTEPAPGAGADPSNLKTTATKDGDDWVIDGHKWYSTGGDPASFLILMARTSDDPKTGASMFIVDRHAEGVKLVRNVSVMAPDVLDHLEGEFLFENVRVGSNAVLANIGEGLSTRPKAAGSSSPNTLHALAGTCRSSVVDVPCVPYDPQKFW